MYRVPFAVVLAALLVVPAFAADTKYTLTGESAKITFVGTKPGGRHEGGFRKVSGTATVTDGNPATLKIEAVIDTDSLYSDNEKLTTHLKSPDFFGVKDHPKATFKTTKVEKTARGYTITGDLTMLGRTKSVSMPATVAAGDALTLASEFKINRNDWGMSYGKGKVDDIVTLKLVVNAKK
jgi:polyisoprenoid-binding protein YceI